MNHPTQRSALRKPLPDELLTAFKAIFEDRVSTSQAMREHHGRDESSYPQPEAVSAAVCSFPSTADAVNTVIQTIQLGVPVARVEFLDENCVRW